MRINRQTPQTFPLETVRNPDKKPSLKAKKKNILRRNCTVKTEPQLSVVYTVLCTVYATVEKASTVKIKNLVGTILPRTCAEILCYKEQACINKFTISAISRSG